MVKLKNDYLVPMMQLKYQVVTEWSLKVETPPEITPQNDSFNCGVFLLAFSKSILAGKKLNFFFEDINQFRDVIFAEITTENVVQEINQPNCNKPILMQKQEDEHADNFDIESSDEDLLEDNEEYEDDLEVSEDEDVKDNYKEDQDANCNKPILMQKQEDEHADNFDIESSDEDLLEDNEEYEDDLEVSEDEDVKDNYKEDQDVDKNEKEEFYDDELVEDNQTYQHYIEDNDSDVKEQIAEDHKIKEKSELREHEGKHTQQIAIRCDLCEKVVKTQKELEVHVSNHAGPSSITCPICTYKAKKEEEIQVHMNMHDDIGTNDVVEADETSEDHIEDNDANVKQEIVEEIFDDLFAKLSLSFDDLINQHVDFDFDLDTFKEEVYPNNALSILTHDEENVDMNTPPVSPKDFVSTSFKQITSSQPVSEKEIFKKRKLEETVDEQNLPPIVSICKNFRLDIRTETPEEQNGDNTTALQTIDDNIEVIDHENPNQYVEVNLIDYPHIKLNDPKIMVFFLDESQYFGLSKSEQQELFNTMKHFVRYRGKGGNLYNKRTFRANPTESIQFLQFYQANYIQDQPIKFHVKIKFKVGDVQTENHQNSIFVENGLLKQDNIKQDQKPFPKSEFQLQNLSLDQFRVFLKLFS